MIAHYKVFNKSLELFHRDVRKLKRDLKDKRLSQFEKQILKSLIDLRNGKNEECFKRISSLKTNENFLKAHKLLVMGLASNNQGQYKKSIEYLGESLMIFENFTSKYHIFFTLESLFVAYTNLYDVDKCVDVFRKLEELGSSCLREEIALIRHRFTILTYKKDFKQANQCLEKLREFFPEFNDTQRISFVINEFNFYLFSKDYSKCYKSLDKMKKLKKFYLKENHIFMKALLDYLSLDKPIYLYHEQLANVEILYWQAFTILNLSEKNKSEALKYWNKLHERYPLVYLDNFRYEGRECLFAICLEKAISKVNIKVSELIIPEAEGKEEFILRLFVENPNVAIDKEQLYSLVWGHEYKEKSDLQKLSKIISRIRKKYNVEIKTKKGSYIHFVENFEKAS